ncbi:PLP-dependent aminotransferase family protein [Neptunicella sp. SCSIO 80796]|uniref:MocR-like pyridoxine biosynthesis transcription factor PdxR n=1 Tax=Neptunicella plasticusilytica TaxID=3117012 RepID=UPI003A4E5F4C
MEPIFELELDLTDLHRGQLLSSLHRQLSTAIMDGRLKAGIRMPASRKLAASLGISRNTVIGVYDMLVSEGYLHSQLGAGTFVATVARPAVRSKAAQNNDPRVNRYWSNPPLFVVEHEQNCQWDFSVGSPELSEFPFGGWQRQVNRQMRLQSKGNLPVPDPQGQPSLRDAIGGFVSHSRAVACDAGQILITTGAQQAFDLIARILVKSGQTRVAMENPGYPMARMAFLAAGAQILDIAVDEEGILVSEIPSSVNIIYVTPSHQFPTGVAMSAARRAQLLALAARHNMVIIEDDYDSEFRLGGPPIDALQTHDRHNSVFYVGTFSKCMLPDIRCGFVVAPRWAMSALIAAKQQTDWHNPVVTQEALAQFIVQGELLRHIRKMRRIYRQRYETILASINKDANSKMRPLPILAGVHVALAVESQWSSKEMVVRAKQVGIKLHSAKEFSTGNYNHKLLVLGFGHISEQAIPAGIEKLINIL